MNIYQYIITEKEADEQAEAEAVAKQLAQDDENLSDVDDEEIEAMILSPIEAKIKSRIWYDANKDYLEEMKIKLQKIEMDRRNGIFVKRVSTLPSRWTFDSPRFTVWDITLICELVLKSYTERTKETQIHTIKHTC